MITISVEELVSKLADIPLGKRWVIGIVGPPGSEKSTVAAGLELALNAKISEYVAILAMEVSISMSRFLSLAAYGRERAHRKHSISPD
ncbi:hypothetical protein C8J36_1249 [Rhizobium sp. PP-F2F-G48]|uniref:hypothetical protein n=1 Tax=Rhizobium sp. PP-F2F-G48 TaxID=2135651 RepID=UPI0010431241|nr:hypothetical protein [Rhizobium sp. PP-F2F-G48]TCM44698.1 hypothetical protein C8J36_1249 [Rhizobium sp. PP-F2F-G48]